MPSEFGRVCPGRANSFAYRPNEGGQAASKHVLQFKGNYKAAGITALRFGSFASRGCPSHRDNAETTRLFLCCLSSALSPSRVQMAPTVLGA